MAKKKNRPNPPKKNDSSIPSVERLAAERKEKEEQELLSDERVQKKLEELENAQKDAEKKLEEDRKALDDEYKDKLRKLEADKADFEKKIAELDLRENEVLEAEEALDKKKAEVAKNTEAEIRANEQAIRADEYRKLSAEWAAEADEAKAKAEADVTKIKAAAETEFNQAHTLRVEAENERLARIHSADKEIQEKYAKLTDEYKAKVDELNATIAEYVEKKKEYELEKAELDEEREYLEMLKERYDGCSEVELKKLQLKIQHLEDINQASQEKISEQSKKIAKLEIRAVDNNGQSAQERIDELEELLETATAQLDEYSNLPSMSRIAELELAEEQLKTFRIELDETKTQLLTSKAQLSAYALDKRELENARTTASALESLNDQLQKKLQYITEQYKSSQESKFQGLLKIDEEKYVASERTEFNGGLADLVEYIRNYGACPKRENPLYYSEETIRVFIASMAASEPASRLLILQGLSGTGKSSLPELFKNALDIRWNSISVQPSWRDNRELLGYDNDFTNRFKETEFTKALYRASSKKYQDDIVLIVLDEMNLARIEYYFADFLSELEHRNSDWKIPLISSYSEPNENNKPQWLNYDNETANIVVTKNIWFVGTANNDDSTSLITDKVYDRAQILDMDEREDPFEGKNVQAKTISFSKLQAMFSNAKKTKAFQMTEEDWTTLNYIDETVLQEMDITFGNRMKTQLDDFVPVYTACGGTKEGAIDYFLAHKILRKLDGKYDAYISDCLDELVEALNENYGENVFEKSLKKIDTVKKRNFGTGE